MHTYLDIFVSLHSILRYLVIISALIVAVQSLMGMLGKKKFMKGNKMGALFMMICCDVQLLVGFIVYYTLGYFNKLGAAGTMSNHYSRFYAVEHPLGMLIAIVLVHVGYSATKKNMDDDRKFKRLFWCSFLALIIFLAQTPWPSKKDVGKPYFPAMIMPH